MKNIRETVMELCQKSDFDIYMGMLDRDISAHRLDRTKQAEIVNKSMETASDIYNDLVAKYGLLTPIKYAIKLDVPVIYLNDKPTKYYTYLGLFEEKNKTITLNLETMKFIRELIVEFNLSDLVDASSLQSCVTAHELFHYFELVRPSLYTNQKIIEAKFLGIFKTRSQLLVAGEVAAMHFAKLLTSLKHTPLVYDKIFVLGKKQIL